MKKKLFTILFSFVFLSLNAQYYETLYVEELINGNSVGYCCANDEFLGVIIYGTDCPNQTWSLENLLGGPGIYEENVDSIIISNSHEVQWYDLYYVGCDIHVYYSLYFALLPPENPFIEPFVWKRPRESVTLESYENGSWSTGEVGDEIEVSESGIYSITLTGPCGSATYSVEVRDNVELYRATVDLRTNKNKVTWLATPEQAEYITEVKVYRDGTFVGTAPYANGYFLDAIGSDAAARTYQIVGVSVEGEDCPIASYQKGTIHTTYYQDVNNDLNMTWNAPYIQEEAEGQLTGYQIYKYNPATEELTLIDEVNTTITNYTCSANAFVGGRAILAATFDRVSPPSGGDGQRPEGADGLETRSFSNLSENMFAVGEETIVNFKVYPNPAKGAFTVEGAQEVTVYNTLGQAVATSRSEEGTHTFTLPPGIYFIKSDEMVKKVVVE